MLVVLILKWPQTVADWWQVHLYFLAHCPRLLKAPQGKSAVTEAELTFSINGAHKNRVPFSISVMPTQADIAGTYKNLEEIKVWALWQNHNLLLKFLLGKNEPPHDVIKLLQCQLGVEHRNIILVRPNHPLQGSVQVQQDITKDLDRKWRRRKISVEKLRLDGENVFLWGLSKDERKVENENCFSTGLFIFWPLYRLSNACSSTWKLCTDMMRAKELNNGVKS